MTLWGALAWLLAAFFTFGGVLNLALPEPIRNDYARWGYPDWFHYVTAALEFLVAAALLFPNTRIFGAALGSAVMAAAVGTTLFHREYKHALAPSLALLLTGALWWRMVDV